MNTCEASKAWERGFTDAFRQAKEAYYPDISEVLAAAEIAFRIMTSAYGNVFESVHTGFNAHYDEPTILFVLKESCAEKRPEIARWATKLEIALYEAGILSMGIMVSRKESTDMETVSADMSFRRSVDA